MKLINYQIYFIDIKVYKNFSCSGEKTWSEFYCMPKENSFC